MRKMLCTLALVVAACSPAPTDTTAGTAPTLGDTGATTATTATTGPTTTFAVPERLTILSHDSFAAGALEADSFADFTRDTGIEIELLQGGDAGTTLSQAILTKDEPVADVLFGVDDTFLSRALEEEIFEPYDSTLLGEVHPELVLDPEHRVTPIDFGDVCLNYDRSYFLDQLPPPATLDDLADPRYGSLLVVEHPATSSPGLAFLLATIGTYGEEGWEEYWRGLVENDVRVAPSWDAAYYGDFTRYEGDRPLVVSYASSPPAEVIFSEEPLDEAPTGVMTEGCYRQIEFAGILAGTAYPHAAGLLIDYMLGLEFQEGIPLTWFVYPANAGATLPPEFVEHTALPSDPVQVDPAEIEANRETWIEKWEQIVLP